MTIANLVEQYGYIAVFVGTFLEGEVILIFAGFAAHRGLVDLSEILILAFLASILADQILFFLGRVYGARLFARYPSLCKKAPRVEALFVKYQTPLILGIRFMYGFRIAGPLIMGSMKIPAIHFCIMNIIGAAIWSVLMVWAGYQLGNILEIMVHDLKHIEEAVLLAIILTGVTWSTLRHYSKSRKRRN